MEINKTERTITVMSINKKLDKKINELCAKHNMDRDFFITKALENYCRYLTKKKAPEAEKKED